MKSNTQYSEIENKYQAKHVDPNIFDKWVRNLKPFSRKHVTGWDTYYRNGEAVVRHRYNENYNCLTVKYRKSISSITDRVEVDLMIQGSPDDAVEFLTRTGYQKEFTIWKDALIYHIDDAGIEISLVLYDIKSKKHSDKRFIEVEIEKSPNVTTKMAKKVLSRWDKVLRERFDLAPAMNQSLYEVYSNKTYKVTR